MLLKYSGDHDVFINKTTPATEKMFGRVGEGKKGLITYYQICLENLETTQHCQCYTYGANDVFVFGDIKIHTPHLFYRARVHIMPARRYTSLYNANAIMSWTFIDPPTAGSFYIVSTDFKPNSYSNRNCMELYYKDDKYWKCKLVDDHCVVRDMQMSRLRFRYLIGKWRPICRCGKPVTATTVCGHYPHCDDHAGPCPECDCKKIELL